MEHRRYLESMCEDAGGKGEGNADIGYQRIQCFRTDQNSTMTVEGDTLRELKRAYEMRDKYRRRSLRRLSRDDTFREPSFEEYVEDLRVLQAAVEHGPVHSYCHSRLQILEHKFDLHKVANCGWEKDANRSDDSDFSVIKKVDVNRIISMGMNASAFTEYIREQLVNDPDQVVTRVPRTTLSELFRSMGINIDNLTLDKLDVQEEESDEIRVTEDRVLLPTDLTPLQTVFLHHENDSKGKFLAALVHEALAVAKKKNVCIEYRILVSGHRENEVQEIADWLCDHRLVDVDNAMWCIMIANTYGRAACSDRDLMKERRRSSAITGFDAPDPFGRKGRAAERTFKDWLNTIFNPILQTGPGTTMARFLQRVGCFAMVGDEQTNHALDASLPSPADWSSPDDPPYHYQLFHIYSRINAINAKRASLGWNVFGLVPTAGEGDTDLPLIASYLLATRVTSCRRLPKLPPLEFLYFLSRIGISMSIISASKLNSFTKNPAASFYKRGLNVCLSTVVPLVTHSGEEPLLEEFVLLKKLFDLSTTDISEVSGLSVRQSSFPRAQKAQWLGENFELDWVLGNDPNRTNVPNMRIDFRSRSYVTELSKILGDDVEAKKTSYDPADVLEPFPFTRVRLLNKELIYQQPANRAVAGMLKEAMSLRDKYVPFASLEQKIRDEELQVESDGLPKDTAFAPPSQTVVKMIDGIVTCDEDGVSFMDIPSASQFANDYKTLVGICNNQLTTSFCQRRTSVLLTSFEIHQCMNGVEEKRTTGDFYSCAKVDNHIHMAAGMSSKELLGFIYDKVRSHGDDIVEFKDGRTQTLDEVYRSLGVDINSLTVDDLDVMADSDNLFHRFDRFNEKYNPLGSPALRECFLKTDNFMAGRYFAQLVNHVLDRVEADEVYYTELRLSIYGRANDEWDRLAKWAATNDVTRWCNKWLIQVPRIYHVFKKRQMLENFGQLIDNIFRPLWEVSIDPRSNWALHQLLAQVVGFDSVDNEKLTDLPFSDRSPSPSNWNTDKNPPYVYWLFYMYANIKTLNTYRAQKGLNTFSLRPHCGESGAVEHLAAAFLTADGINHGINLRKSPTLQYLYYLSQIPVSASPLSNNALFLPLSKNPFATFFKSGLNITLSTDDPLQFHLTQEALVEEYSVASKLWKFSTTDLVEIARNSVLMSGFSFQVKSKHLGPLYILSSSNGNQRYRSRLSDTRVAYRYETLVEEHTMLEKLTDSPVPHVFSTKAEEEVVIRRYALHGYLSPAFARNASETQQTTQAPVTRGNQSKPAGMSRVSFMRSPGLPPNVGLSSTYSSGTQLQRVAVGSPMSAVAAKTVRISVQYCDCQRLVLDRSNVPVGLTEDADKKWDTLKTAIEKYCREELGVSNFRILSQERKHLTAWAPCIALDRAVICETRDFSPDSD